MIEKLKRGVSVVRARNSTLPRRWPSPGATTIGSSPTKSGLSRLAGTADQPNRNPVADSRQQHQGRGEKARRDRSPPRSLVCERWGQSGRQGSKAGKRAEEDLELRDAPAVVEAHDVESD